MEPYSTSKKSALISIIVAVYNGGHYLKECIESIMRQSYGNLEIVLIDDGSTDGSGVILDTYAQKDTRIKVLHQNNQGVSAARNRGLEISKGRYIGIVDQDDCLSEEYVSYFYELAESTKAEIALTPEADKFRKVMHQLRESEDDIRVMSGREAMEMMLYHKIVIAPWNKIIRRDLIEKNGIKFNPRLFGGEGFAFSIECFQKAKAVTVGSRKIYHYRVGNPESGASKFREATIRSSLEAQMYIKSIFEEETDRLLTAWIFSNWHTHCDCLNVMVGCGVIKQHKEMYRTLKKECRRNALCALKAPVVLQQRVRGILFLVNPYLAARVINHFRIRRFSTKGSQR